MVKEYTFIIGNYRTTIRSTLSREATFSFVKAINPGRSIAYLNRYNCPISLQLKMKNKCVQSPNHVLY